MILRQNNIRFVSSAHWTSVREHYFQSIPLPHRMSPLCTAPSRIVPSSDCQHHIRMTKVVTPLTLAHLIRILLSPPFVPNLIVCRPFFFSRIHRLLFTYDPSLSGYEPLMVSYVLILFSCSPEVRDRSVKSVQGFICCRL